MLQRFFSVTAFVIEGYVIKKMQEDGSCLFRAVADQIYGDEEMHSCVRGHCMDYIVSLSVLLWFPHIQKFEFYRTAACLPSFNNITYFRNKTVTIFLSMLRKR